MGGVTIAGETPSFRPREAPWAAAVYAATNERQALGAGVVIDAQRILTCKHVVQDAIAAKSPLWVAFPKAGVARHVRRVVAEVRVADADDLAILVLTEPVPAQVTPAPLRSPQAADLVDERWWAFGFPADSDHGADAHGTVGTDLAYGWVLLHTESRYPVRPGFSGGGLWSARYGAVVALVGQVRRGGDRQGDALALTLHQAIAELPDEGLAALTAWTLNAASESALAAWGWSLDTDAEAVRHWRPRGRGVSVDSEGGYRFRGRTAALERVVAWLDRPVPDRRVLVVTGSPGVGKSAVLGRVVTTANAGIVAALPADDRNVRATLGSIACAVHAKGKSALDVAAEIARAASARLPEEVDQLAPALREVLGQRPGRRFNVVIDALDEAVDPVQARLIVTAIVLPVAQTCADVGAQLLVGTRHADDGGDLFGSFGSAANVLNLDDEGYFEEEDLAAYALATLQLVGAERPANPYADPAVAAPVARRIAALADRNFLIAGLVARAHGLYDTTAAEPARLAFDATVDAALNSYLSRLVPVASVPARLVLTALAYAQLPGISAEIWSVALASLGARVDPDSLVTFTRSAAANFLIETTSESGVRQYRLFHQALNDALLNERERRFGGRQTDERALTDGLIALGRRSSWQHLDRYLLQSLPTHADRAGIIHELLTDDEYLLHADLTRLTPLVDHVATAEGRARARLLQLTPRAIPADPRERAALFSVTQALERLEHRFTHTRDAPYRAVWAWVTSRVERAVLDGHTAPVYCVCQINVDGSTRVASGGRDGTVRIWEPATGRQERVLLGHDGAVHAVCRLDVDGSVRLATAGEDHTVRIWDPATGRQDRILTGHDGEVNALCQVVVGETVCLATGGQDGVVRIWDPVTGRLQRSFSTHDGEINALCLVLVGNTVRLASGGAGHTVKVWDAATGYLEREMTTAGRAVFSLWQVRAGDQVLLAGTCGDRRVRLWDPVTGAYKHECWSAAAPQMALCPIVLDGRVLMAAVSDDSTVRLRHPLTGDVLRTLKGYAGEVNAMCQVTVRGRVLLASASSDRMVRLWDPAIGQRRPDPADHTAGVNAVCRIELPGRTLLATAGTDGTVRFWNAATGRHEGAIGNRNPVGVRSVCELRTEGQILLASATDNGTVQVRDPFGRGEESLFATHTGAINDLCAITLDERTLLAGAGQDGTIWLWDPVSRRGLLGRRPPSRVDRHSVHSRGISAVVPVEVDGRELLLTGSVDRTVRLTDPATGELLQTCAGHTGAVKTVMPVTVDGRVLLASGSADRTVRLWDPYTGRQEAVLTGHTDAVNVVLPVPVDGYPFLASGSSDRTVRLWDPLMEATVISIPVYHKVLACTQVSNTLAIGVAAGIITVSLHV
ncbi:trypsin-like peptidase domain-containing protein [Dactylosporangium sp. NPDC050688]|uniref:trypsin-like peptidase domain-containing protein n=1 Tax=Dactylosporangium sp. NPDC050688 TaxID=3157217 RepID=UPI003409DA0B